MAHWKLYGRFEASKELLAPRKWYSKEFDRRAYRKHEFSDNTQVERLIQTMSQIEKLRKKGIENCSELSMIDILYKLFQNHVISQFFIFWLQVENNTSHISFLSKVSLFELNPDVHTAVSILREFFSEGGEMKTLMPSTYAQEIHEQLEEVEGKMFAGIEVVLSSELFHEAVRKLASVKRKSFQSFVGSQLYTTLVSFSDVLITKYTRKGLIESSPMHRSAEKDNEKRLRQLLEKNYPVDFRNNTFETPLHLAANRNCTRVVELLLSYGADPQARDHKGDSSLHLACRNNSLEVVDILLRNNTNPELLNLQKQMPAELADDIRIVELFKKRRQLSTFEFPKGTEATHLMDVMDMLESLIEGDSPPELPVKTMFPTPSNVIRYVARSDSAMNMDQGLNVQSSKKKRTKAVRLILEDRYISKIFYAFLQRNKWEENVLFLRDVNSFVDSKDLKIAKKMFEDYVVADKINILTNTKREMLTSKQHTENSIKEGELKANSKARLRMFDKAVEDIINFLSKDPLDMFLRSRIFPLLMDSSRLMLSEATASGKIGRDVRRRSVSFVIEKIDEKPASEPKALKKREHEFIYSHRTGFCHNCSELMWGISKKSSTCKRCGIVCHRRCMDDVKTKFDCVRDKYKSKADEKTQEEVDEEKAGRPRHVFKKTRYAQPTCCQHCRKMIFLKNGLECELCHLQIHNGCEKYTSQFCINPEKSPMGEIGVQIVEAKNLPSEMNTYVVVTCGRFTARTQTVPHSKDPVWDGDTFFFDIFSQDDQLSIKLYSSKTSYPIGLLAPSLTELVTHQEIDMFQVLEPDEGAKSQEAVGELRVKLNFNATSYGEEKLTGAYDKLKDLFLEDDSLLLAIVNTSVLKGIKPPDPNDQFAESLVSLYASEGKLEALVSMVVAASSTSANHEDSILREDSIACSIILKCIERVGKRWLKHALYSIMKMIISNADVIPNKLPPSERVNEVYFGILEEFVAKIISTPIDAPLAALLFRIGKMVKMVWPGGERAVIVRLFYGTFMAKAITMPLSYGLTKKHQDLTEMQAETLNSVSALFSSACTGLELPKDIVAFNGNNELNRKAHSTASVFHEYIMENTQSTKTDFPRVKHRIRGRDIFVIRRFCLNHIDYILAHSNVPKSFRELVSVDALAYIPPIDKADKDGNAAIHRAAYWGDKVKVKLALKRGATLDLVNSQGESALHIASAGGFLEVVKILIAAGANINLQSFVGDTPLHNASIHQNDECVEIICFNDADISIVNDNGKTPVDLATTPKAKKIFARLKEYEKDIEMSENKEERAKTIVRSLTSSKTMKLVGKWHLKETLGAGAFGRVVRAVHIDNKKEAAVKIIRKDKITDSETLIRLNREIGVMKAIHDPRIVEFYDVIDKPNKIYLVMELLNGGDMFDLIIENEAIDDAAAADLFREVVEGVYQCHSRNIVHRDIKPENILLDRSRKHIKLIDFGLATVIKDRSELLKTCCGSPFYVAPEVLAGVEYSYKCDVWAMGVTLFAMLCGYLPVDDENQGVMIEKMLHVDRYLTFPQNVTPLAEDLIRKMLQPKPDKRISLEEVANHPWVDLNLSSMIGQPFPSKKDPEKVILTQMQKLGFDRSKVVAAVSKGQDGVESRFYDMLADFQQRRKKWSA